MTFYRKISKNLTFEMDLFRFPFGDVLFDFCISVDPRHKYSHTPYYGIVLVILYFKVFEFNIHDDRHAGEEEDDSEIHN